MDNEIDRKIDVTAILILLVQNRQQTRDWTLIGSGASGLGIQEWQNCLHKTRFPITGFQNLVSETGFPRPGFWNWVSETGFLKAGFPNLVSETRFPKLCFPNRVSETRFPKPGFITILCLQFRALKSHPLWATLYV